MGGDGDVEVISVAVWCCRRRATGARLPAAGVTVCCLAEPTGNVEKEAFDLFGYILIKQ